MEIVDRVRGAGGSSSSETTNRDERKRLQNKEASRRFRSQNKSLEGARAKHLSELKQTCANMATLPENSSFNFKPFNDVVVGDLKEMILTSIAKSKGLS